MIQLGIELDCDLVLNWISFWGRCASYWSCYHQSARWVTQAGCRGTWSVLSSYVSPILFDPTCYAIMFWVLGFWFFWTCGVPSAHILHYIVFAIIAFLSKVAGVLKVLQLFVFQDIDLTFCMKIIVYLLKHPYHHTILGLLINFYYY